MEPQNQVMLETIFPDFCSQMFWRSSYVDGVKVMLPYPKSWSYCDYWYQSVYKLYLTVELVLLLAYGSWCMLF